MLGHITAAGELCYLDTLEAHNVPFYERHGFRVVTEGDMPERDIHIWVMRRDPTA